MTKKAKPELGGQKIGRPSKIDDVIVREFTEGGKTVKQQVTVADAILETIRVGNYKETAARFAGIGDSTLYRWLDWGDPEHPAHGNDPSKQLYRDFREALQKAEAEAETYDLALIAQASRETTVKCPSCNKPHRVPGDWHAAAWRRERMAPEKYGRRQQIVLQEETAVQIALDLLELLRTSLEKHVTDPAERQAVLTELIESGITGGASSHSAARSS